MNEENIKQTEQKHHDELLDEIRAINIKLDPIYETYQAWLTLGKWGKTFIYLIGAVLGLIVAWKQIFNPH